MSNSRGMTLIEIMIVLVIIGGMLVVGASRFSNTNNEIRSLVRKIASLTKDLHNQARLQNKVIRMVIEMPENEETQISVESAPKNTLLTDNAFSEDPDEESRLSEEERKEKAALKAFQPDTSIMRKPITVPLPLRIVEVAVRDTDEPIQSGRAFLYFFPQGLTQEAIIVISDNEDLNWTVAVNPITGISQIIPERKKLEELRSR